MVCRSAQLKCDKCGNADLRQEEDVLDTWFSSALWPFSTLGWPDKTPELKKYYPTSVLVTGFDIIFFWVARMMMMGIKFMDQVPFRDVYIHALVRDSSGQKMSKSKGNVIDPLILMDKYGTDSFRFTLAAFAAQGRDIRFSEDRVEGYRHFVNKLWNAARFILLNAEGALLPDDIDRQKLDIGSRWILSRLSFAAEEIDHSLADFRFNDAASSIYQFIWHELCDWYIEMVKPVLYDESADRLPVRQCLLYILERTLRLLHPFMPFVTEEIWQNIPHKGESIVTAEYPRNLVRETGAEEHMSVIMEAVTGIRTIRGELNLSPNLQLKAHIKTLTDDALDILSGNLTYLNKLAKADIVEIGAGVKKIKGSSVSVRNHVEVYVPLEGLLDLDLEIDRLRKEEAKVEESIIFLNKKILSDNFMKKAPQEVIAKEQDKYGECLKKKERILENLKKMYEAKGGK